MSKVSGILCPIFSLVSEEGIGTFGRGAYQFVDFLKKSQQKLWQILPLGITSYGDSPYQSFSSFAGNPYFIDLKMLQEKGWLELSDLQQNWGNLNYVDYEQLWQKKYPLLQIAYQNSRFSGDDYKRLIKQWAWLEDFCLFMSLKDENNGQSCAHWESYRSKSDLDSNKKNSLLEKCYYHAFLQNEFFEQWFALKEYANKSQIQVIGDLPIFVSRDSADFWANPEVFLCDSEGQLSVVAGVPPDYFSETGQLWGNPLYNWEYLQSSSYAWWNQRIEVLLTLYDILRIDHFRAFESYWAIPSGSETAINGEWRKAYGKEFFEQLKQKYTQAKIIAEDLGIITDEVRDLMHQTGFPGMVVLQFAFGGGDDNRYLPHHVQENQIIYTGTHDNDTTRGWFENEENQYAVRHAQNYMNKENSSAEEFVKGLIELAMSSACKTVIIPIQDILCLGSETRINTPSTLGDNWKWRMLSLPSSQEQNYLKEISIKNIRNIS